MIFENIYAFVCEKFESNDVANYSSYALSIMADNYPVQSFDLIKRFLIYFLYSFFLSCLSSILSSNFYTTTVSLAIFFHLRFFNFENDSILKKSIFSSTTLKPRKCNLFGLLIIFALITHQKRLRGSKQSSRNASDKQIVKKMLKNY